MSDTAAGAALPEIIEGEDGTVVARFPEIEDKNDRRVGRDSEEHEDDVTERDEGSETGRTRSRAARRREQQKRAAHEREQEIGQLKSVVGTQQQMIEAIFQGQQHHTLTTLQNEAQRAQVAHREAQARHAAAVEKGDGAAATEAMTVMRNAEIHYTAAAGQHNALVEKMKAKPRTEEDEGGEQQQDRRERQPRRSAEADRFKEDFLDKHAFIDFNKDDDDQAMIKTIDARVMRDGFKPDTQDYWDELSERLQEKLPHLFDKKGGRQVRHEERDRGENRDDQQQEQRPRRRGPPLGDGGRGRDQGRQGDVHLTPDMVKGLEEAGIPLVGGDAAMQKRRANVISSWRARPQSN